MTSSQGVPSTTGALYVCGTPIGNLGDVTHRFLETLRFVDWVAAEDTRNTVGLLAHFEIEKPLVSLQNYNEGRRVRHIAQLLLEGKNIALVSDAGTPNVSDPGGYLVGELRSQGFPIIPIPGVSAVTTLVSIAGLRLDQFWMVGFLPKKQGELNALISPAANGSIPVVFFEAPTRLLSSLERLHASEMVERVILGKELTKKFETVFEGTIPDLLARFDAEQIRGEWVGLAVTRPKPTDHESILAEINGMGLTQKQAVAVGKMLGLPRNFLYRHLIDQKGGGDE